MLHWPMIALGWVVNIFERGEASHGPHPRDPRRAARDPRRGARAGDRAARRGRVPRPHLRLRRRRAGAARRRPARAGGQHGGDRGAHRLRQEHARQPDPAPVRRAAGHACSWTATTCGALPARACCAARSASCRRRRFLFSDTRARERGLRPARGRRRRDERVALGRRASRSSRKDVAGLPARATRPSWASAASRSPAARSSARPWRARWPSTRASWSSTTRSPRWTPRPRRRSCAGCASVMATRTTFLVSHRVSTVKDADLIVVLRGGPHRGAGHPRRAAGAGRLLRRPPPPAAPGGGDGDGRRERGGCHEDDPVDKSYDRALLRRLLRYLRPYKAAVLRSRSC